MRADIFVLIVCSRLVNVGVVQSVWSSKIMIIRITVACCFMLSVFVLWFSISLIITECCKLMSFLLGVLFRFVSSACSLMGILYVS